MSIKQDVVVNSREARDTPARQLRFLWLVLAMVDTWRRVKTEDWVGGGEGGNLSEEKSSDTGENQINSMFASRVFNRFTVGEKQLKKLNRNKMR